MRKITNDQARRFALAAQGFNDGRATGRVDVRHFRKVLDHVGLIQLDSVNVFSRAHYMPFFSRLGPYERESLDSWAWQSRELFEYWGHEASLLPAERHRLLRWRMARPLNWRAMKKLEERNPDYIEGVLQQVAENGPLQTKQLEDPGARLNQSMWNWSVGKLALEVLFLKGLVTTADRVNFTRLYDITERVIPTLIVSWAEPARARAAAKNGS